MRIGLDPILGLVPGIGDAAGAVLATTLLVGGCRRGVTRVTLLRMAATIGLDALAGSVPVIGDIFDAAWKANLRNIALLERHAASPAGAKQADRLMVITVCALLLILCLAAAAGAAFLTALIVKRVW